jgi:hypothetical protein
MVRQHISDLHAVSRSVTTPVINSLATWKTADEHAVDRIAWPMATHDVSLNITKPIPVGNVDIEIPVRRNGRAFGKVKISKGAIDWMPANKSKTAYYLDWGEFAKVMAQYGRPV